VDHSIILQYIQALGFPICSSIALGWALWKIGGALLAKFFQHVDAIVPKIDRIAESNEEISNHVSKWPSDLVNKISDQVVERMRRELAERGCNLSAAEVKAVIEQRHRGKNE